jgi:class 3 adenylate cyclase
VGQCLVSKISGHIGIVTMASNDTFTYSTQDGPPPQDQSPRRAARRSTSMLGIKSSESLSDVDDQSNATGGSLNLSGLRSLNHEDSYDEHSSSETFEDEKAKILAQLMSDHSEAVSASLVERTMLIQSVIWLSHHVPGCVLKLLFETILLHRNTLKGWHVSNTNSQVELTGDSDIMNAMRSLSTQETTPSDAKANSEASDEPTNISSHRADGFLQPLNDENEYETTIHSFLPAHEESLPISKKHDSALLFVDMSGFTKISTILDVESLSNAINSYFQLIVNEVTTHGGDILKFAGDAIFAEWKASRRKPDQNIEFCVMRAAQCAASIVANCSDYPIHSRPVGVSRASIRLETARQSFKAGTGHLRSSVHSSSQGSNRNLRASVQSADEFYRRGSIMSDDSREELNTTGPYRRRSSTGGHAPKPVKLATLNVKCGIGVGRIVGVHVGDNTKRREYLILGDPIDQVAAAEGAATNGEVFASPEAVEILSRVAELRQTSIASIKENKPLCIAERQQQFFDITQKQSRTEGLMSNDPESILHRCEDLNCSELRWLKNMISLYVHPVVVNDENESLSQLTLKRESDLDRHISEAELRNVFVMFISPMIDYKLTGDEEKDKKLINLLNDIMNLTTRHLNKVGGHLRQFIVDDKGVVIICTFGLRGSTFPNMISQRALPLTRAIYDSLQEELGVKSKIGGTFGRAYCGVVGGLTRHEFAVLGPSVNLAARLMASKFNPSILVDKNVRLLTSHSQIFFKPLPPVTAKGYDEPVPIFEPLKSVESKWGKLKPNFIGRSNEIKQIMQIAKGMTMNSDASKFIFITAASGSGKSTMIAQTTARVRAMVKKLKKSIITTRHISNQGDSRVPFR